MHKSLDPTWIGALCWRAREFASGDLVLRKLWPGFGTWLLLLLALVVVVPTPASAQNGGPCTLLLQGSNPADPLTITAVVNCVAGTAGIIIDWGDGSPTTTSGGASITATHTYVFANCSIGQPPISGICQINVSVPGFDCCAVSGYVDLTAPAATPVFNGQSWNVNVSMFGVPQGLQVTFECTTVTDSTGGVQQASALGITCSSNPITVTFTGGLQTVAIGIHTSGTALGSLVPAMRHKNVLYALFLPLSAFFLLGVRVGTLRSSRSTISNYVVTGMVILLIVFFPSCSGGFTPNPPAQSTPPGAYQVTVIDTPVAGQNTTGFVQTSLIVPLTVNQVQ